MNFINFIGANDAFFEEFDAESIEIIELGTVTRADKTTALGQFRNGEYASFEDGKAYPLSDAKIKGALNALAKP